MIPKQTEYKVGMYLRLSNEDERAGESLSIENQRKILSNYISEQGWTLYDEYVDDGISGTTFDRPGVQRMLDDAKNGRINLILCKDLSRFGRNYIQVPDNDRKVYVCQYCGTEMKDNYWSYHDGGYVCYWCDKKYYHNDD